MHTNASLHVHPAAANPDRIFEIRRLAQRFGCPYIPLKPKPQPQNCAPFGPNGGGSAA